ncbi:hypothetical protein HAX54_034124 [Datura stramonium]|uniref:Uncharacterized protein n=1 Tax=Datura stramonium TaxID=4076 RepID=A0ABS8VGM8_DATST|nr:hypothetical protein [Datura stramonium]
MLDKIVILKDYPIFRTLNSYLIYSIPEDNDASSLEEEVVLQSIKEENKAMRRLQFSDVGNSTHPTPGTEEVRHNRKEGKCLSYIPPVLKDGMVTVTIEEDDIKMQLEIWESALIGEEGSTKDTESTKPEVMKRKRAREKVDEDTDFLTEGRAPAEEYDGTLIEPPEYEGKKEGNTMIGRTGELGGGYENSAGNSMPSHPP